MDISFHDRRDYYIENGRFCLQLPNELSTTVLVKAMSYYFINEYTLRECKRQTSGNSSEIETI